VSFDEAADHIGPACALLWRRYWRARKLRSEATSEVGSGQRKASKDYRRSLPTYSERRSSRLGQLEGTHAGEDFCTILRGRDRVVGERPALPEEYDLESERDVGGGGGEEVALRSREQTSAEEEASGMWTSGKRHGVPVC